MSTHLFFNRIFIGQIWLHFLSFLSFCFSSLSCFVPHKNDAPQKWRIQRKYDNPQEWYCACASTWYRARMIPPENDAEQVWYHVRMMQRKYDTMRECYWKSSLLRVSHLWCEHFYRLLYSFRDTEKGGRRGKRHSTDKREWGQQLFSLRLLRAL